MDKKDIIKAWRNPDAAKSADLIPAIPGGIREVCDSLLEEIAGGFAQCCACSSGTVNSGGGDQNSGHGTGNKDNASKNGSDRDKGNSGTGGQGGGGGGRGGNGGGGGSGGSGGNDDNDN